MPYYLSWLRTANGCYGVDAVIMSDPDESANVPGAATCGGLGVGRSACLLSVIPLCFVSDLSNSGRYIQEDSSTSFNEKPSLYINSDDEPAHFSSTFHVYVASLFYMDVRKTTYFFLSMWLH